MASAVRDCLLCKACERFKPQAPRLDDVNLSTDEALTVGFAIGARVVDVDYLARNPRALCARHVRAIVQYLANFGCIPHELDSCLRPSRNV